jgi:hypothetical protein
MKLKIGIALLLIVLSAALLLAFKGNNSPGPEPYAQLIGLGNTYTFIQPDGTAEEFRLTSSEYLALQKAITLKLNELNDAGYQVVGTSQGPMGVIYLLKRN